MDQDKHDTIFIKHKLTLVSHEYRFKLLHKLKDKIFPKIKRMVLMYIAQKIK